MKATGDSTNMMIATTTPASSDPFNPPWLGLLVKAGFGIADTGLSFFKRTIKTAFSSLEVNRLPLETTVVL